MSENKALAAKLGRQLLAGEIPYEEFVNQFPEDKSDDEIEELLSLIEHQPKPGGLFGVSKNEYMFYQQKIWGVIEKLERHK